jgi:hypothetical protein
MLRRSALSLLLAALAVGCATDSEDPEASRAAHEATGPLTGRSIEFALDVDALDHDAMNAIGKRIEVQTGAESLRIEVRKSDDDGTTVAMEAWGRTAITDEALVADLRAQFPALKNAVIDVRALAGEAPSHPAGELDFEVDKDEDPELLRQRITEELRAKGVQGEVQVHVDDHDDGKREVRVEVEDEHTVTR